MTTQLFDKAFQYAMRHEGGYVHHKNDPGGATNYGISLRWLKNQNLEIGDIDKDGDIDINDIKGMTVDAARLIYYKTWWIPNGFDRLPYEIAVKMFDTAINMGPRQAAKILQSACCNTGKKITIDGVIGDRTIQAINEVYNEKPTRLRQCFIDSQKEFYKLLARKNPKFRSFIRGWTKRAESWPIVNNPNAGNLAKIVETDFMRERTPFANLTESKPQLQSKTIVGLVVSAVGGIAHAIGYQIDANVTYQLATIAVEIGGLVFSWYGRVNAEKPVAGIVFKKRL